ncbi:Uncharacterized protein Adt_16020 [Abeliophyllum distichum]|uniref:DUF4283 domain-containing protein n=1 Tax=Abeliophyllum distichum TaxID=126358 RepID=A0ABD1U4U0_9LAMI
MEEAAPHPKPPDKPAAPPTAAIHVASSTTSRAWNKYFSSLFTSPTPSNQPFFIIKPTTFMGEPFIKFSRADILEFSSKSPYALVGKFSRSKPPMNKVRSSLATFDFKGHYQVGLLDYKHIIIEFGLEEDYVRLFSKSIWVVAGSPMRIFKWSYDFDPRVEQPVVPIWIALPLLPYVFFNKKKPYFPLPT